MSEGRVGAPVGGNDIARQWRWFFGGAALFNFAVGLSAMFTPVPGAESRIIGLLIFAFGIIYSLVARDPQRFAPVLWAGVVGKLGFVALLAGDAFGQSGNVLGAAIVSLNAVFAVGFLAFLLTRDESLTEM